MSSTPSIYMLSSIISHCLNCNVFKILQVMSDDNLQSFIIKDIRNFQKKCIRSPLKYFCLILLNIKLQTGCT